MAAVSNHGIRSGILKKWTSPATRQTFSITFNDEYSEEPTPAAASWGNTASASRDANANPMPSAHQPAPGLVRGTK